MDKSLKNRRKLSTTGMISPSIYQELKKMTKELTEMPEIKESLLSPRGARDEANSRWEVVPYPNSSDFEVKYEHANATPNTRWVDPLKEAKVTPASEKQVGGDHYKKFKIQPYKFCYENGLNNLQSEVVSYICRYKYKWAHDPTRQLEDLKKAKHTIDLLIEEIYKEMDK